MEAKNNEEIWHEYIENFSSYEGTVTDYCKENSISKNQYYYYLKKFKKMKTAIFHAIELNDEPSTLIQSKNAKEEIKSIKIELGKAKIYIPSENSTLITSVIKELLRSC